jgi:hypothetical protein
MKALYFLALSLLTLQTMAADLRLTTDEERIKEATDKCMSLITGGHADDAFSGLFKELWKEKNTIGQATMAMQRQYRNVASRAEDALGQPIPGGYEFIGVRRLGTGFVKLIYVQKNELAFLPWSFSFYKPNKDFKLSHIAFPDVTSDDIKDMIVVVLAPER